MYRLKRLLQANWVWVRVSMLPAEKNNSNDNNNFIISTALNSLIYDLTRCVQHDFIIVISQRRLMVFAISRS